MTPGQVSRLLQLVRGNVGNVHPHHLTAKEWRGQLSQSGLFHLPPPTPKPLSSHPGQLCCAVQVRLEGLLSQVLQLAGQGQG